MNNWLEKLYDTFIVDENYMLLLKGFGNTLLITLCALAIGVVIGGIIAIAKYFAEDNRKLKFLNWICDIYTTVIRGVPVTVLLMIFYFIIIVSDTNGILTANFIVVLMLCMVGFLIFWILSIRSRELQFGIFRAMGLSMGEVIRMLAVEQVLISGSSILIGVGVGALVTRLYLPLIQIAYSTADQVLPLKLVTEASDYVRLFTVIAAMVICCMGILAWLISKIRIAQALKLGED